MLLRQSRVLNAVLIVLDIAFYGENTEPVSASQIAHRTFISRRSIEPVLQALAKSKVLKSVRGPRGGYKIRDYSISLREIIEPLLDIDSSNKEEQQAGILYTDVLLPFWRECDKKMLNWMQDITVADLVKKANHLGIKRVQQYPLTFSI